jgi:hypothetical protein
MSGAVAGLIGSLKAAVVAALTTKYFIATNTAPVPFSLNAVAADSLGNSYWASNNFDSATHARTGALLIKKAVDGSVVWAKTIGTYATATNYQGDTINGMKIAGSTIYVWGALHENISLTGCPWLATYDLDGNLLTQYSATADEVATFYKGEIDSSGYFHTYVRYNSGKGSGPYELIFSPTMQNVSNNFKFINSAYPQGIVSRPTDNAVFRAFYDDASAFNGVTITAAGAPGTTDSTYKFNSSNTSFGLSYGSYSPHTGAKLIDFDSSGNLYVVFYEYAGFGGSTIVGGMVLAKFNTSMVLQWSRKIQAAGGTGRSITPYALKVDRTNNFVYIIGNEYLQTGTVLVKYNTSGTIQWKNKIRLLSGGTDIDVPAVDMTVDSNGNALLAVRTDSRGFALKIKGDGSQATGSTLTLSGTSPVYTSIISTATNTELAYAYTVSATSNSNYTARSTNNNPFAGTMSATGFYTPTITNIASTYAEKLYITT